MCPYFCKSLSVVMYLGNSGMSLFLRIFLPFVPISWVSGLASMQMGADRAPLCSRVMAFCK